MNTLRASLRTHRALLLIVLLYAAAATLLAGGLPSPSDILNVLAGFLLAILTGPIFILCGYTIRVMVVQRPHRLCHYLYHDLRRYLSNERLLHALPAAVIGTDHDGVVRYLNPRAGALGGLLPGDGVGQPVTQLLPLFHDLRSCVTHLTTY